MRGKSIIVILILGIGAIYAEARPIKAYSLYFSWVNSVPFILVCIMTGVFLVRGLIRFVKRKGNYSFLPLSVSALLTLVLFGIMRQREMQDNSATQFFADTDMVGNDGGMRFDFKKNGHLKAERHDHWVETLYWGKYQMKKDTILLDIPLDFKLGKEAVLTDAALKFVDDTVSFRVVKPLGSD